MPDRTIAKLRQMGAAARAAGVGITKNPMFGPEQEPTDPEAKARLTERRLAWMSGWLAECDRMEQRARSLDYSKTPEVFGAPDPTASDYVGSYDPGPPYKSNSSRKGRTVAAGVSVAAGGLAGERTGQRLQNKQRRGA